MGLMNWGSSHGAERMRLSGRRVTLRPLISSDFDQWSEVRQRSRDWLLKWEPRGLPGMPDATRDRRAFASRCAAREREFHLGTAYGFGVFVGSRFCGEINLNSVQRGAAQSAYVGYWIDRAMAGHSYTPEALVVICRFGFEELALHRIQASIIPRNTASRRVVEKLSFRSEGMAERYLEINGVWEDHLRFAITVEEWEEKRDQYLRDWVLPEPSALGG